MGYKQYIGLFGFCVGTLLGSSSAAVAGEPLIVSRLRDPDPGLVPVPEPELKLTTLSGVVEGEAGVDTVMKEFGRAIGDAVYAQEQAKEARCRSVAPGGGRATERFAWAADCLYSRH